jgi:hypothetical protein
MSRKNKMMKKYKFPTWLQVILLLILWLPILFFTFKLITSDATRKTDNIVKIQSITGETIQGVSNLICWYKNAPHGYTYWLKFDVVESSSDWLFSNTQHYNTVENRFDYEELLKNMTYPKQWLHDDFIVKYIDDNSTNLVIVGKELGNTNTIVLKKGYHKLGL